MNILSVCVLPSMHDVQSIHHVRRADLYMEKVAPPIEKLRNTYSNFFYSSESMTASKMEFVQFSTHVSLKHAHYEAAILL